MTCTCVVHDHYWWIEAEDLNIEFGPSPRAYIADSWLEPIKSDDKEQEESFEEKKFAMNLILG